MLSREVQAMVDLIEKHDCLNPIDNNHDRQKFWNQAATEYNEMFGTKLTRATFRTKWVYKITISSSFFTEKLNIFITNE